MRLPEYSGWSAEIRLIYAMCSAGIGGLPILVSDFDSLRPPGVLECAASPADDRFPLDDDEMILPLCPGFGNQHPEKAVPSFEFRSFDVSFVDNQLLSLKDDLQDQFVLDVTEEEEIQGGQK